MIGKIKNIVRLKDMTDTNKRLLADLIAKEITFEECNDLIDALRDLADFVGDSRTAEFERKFVK